MMANRKQLGPAEIIPPLVAVVGTVIWISIDGFTGESIAESLTSLCTMFVILIPLYKHILKKPMDTHLESGIRACVEVQEKYPDFLTGPKFRKDDYTPGTPHTDHQFLFVQKPGSRHKAAFVPVAPFSKAILEISITPATLELIGIKGTLTEVSAVVHEAVLNFADKHYQGLFIEKTTQLYPDICIVLDFDIERVNVKDFRVIARELILISIRSLLNQATG